jgi:hypothetical protein
MFVRYFAEVPLPAHQVEAVLLVAAEDWLPAVAVGASEHGERLLARAGAGPVHGTVPGAGVAPDHAIEVEVGRAVRFPSKLAVPISWRPAGGSGLLPALDAEIEVGALGPDQTQLAVNGRYARVVGSAGNGVDRFLLHRVAEATMKRFLDEVAGEVTSRALDGRQAWSSGARPDW